MGDLEGLGQRLKVAIRQADLTQKQAQEKLEKAKVRGASYANFYKILSGKAPSADFVVDAARELGVSAGWLLTGKGEQQEREPYSQEDVERYGLQDLPEPIQHDVLNLTQTLIQATDTKGLILKDSQRRIEDLSKGIAAWLRIPPLSDKFRSPETDLEATAYCDLALRALRSLIPTPGELTPGGYDQVFAELTSIERALAGRQKFTNKDPGQPDTPARVGVRLQDERASEEGPASRGQGVEKKDKLSTEWIPLSKEDVEVDGSPEELRFEPKPNTLGPALVDDADGSQPE